MQPPIRLLALDGIRGFAALWVVLVHLPILWSFYQSPLLSNTYALLSVFFVFSGFVVAMMYGRGLATMRDSARFTMKRFGRLWPLHALTLGILVALESVRALVIQAGLVRSEIAPFTDSGSITGIFEHLFLVQAWGWDKPMEWNFPSWTISTEFAAYAIVCAISMLAPLLKWRLWLSGGSLVVAGLIFGQQTGWWTQLHGPSVSRCVMDFFVGYIAYFAFQRWPMTKAPILGTVLEVGLFGYTIVIASLQLGGAWLLSCSLAYGAMVWVFATEQGLLSRIARLKPMVWLGNISLGIYLLHVPVIAFMAAGLSVLNRLTGVDLYVTVLRADGQTAEVLTLGSALATNALALGYVVVIVAASALAHRYVEHPTRLWFAALADRWFGKRAQTTADEPMEGVSARSQ